MRKATGILSRWWISWHKVAPIYYLISVYSLAFCEWQSDDIAGPELVIFLFQPSKWWIGGRERHVWILTYVWMMLQLSSWAKRRAGWLPSSLVCLNIWTRCTWGTLTQISQDQDNSQTKCQPSVSTHGGSYVGLSRILVAIWNSSMFLTFWEILHWVAHY